MARQGWGRHSTVATGSDSGDQVSVNAWNADINKVGMLGFTGETIASATSITPTSTTLILSGSTNVSTIATTNTAEYDLLYIFTSGTVTLVNTSSPSSAGDIKLLANANTDLSQSVPTILIRKGNFWYEYGGSPVTDASITFAKIQNLATMKVIGRTAASTGVSSEVAILDEDNMASDSAVSLATQQSIKAYVDAQSHSTVTASSTTTFTNKSIDLTDNTLTGTSLELKTAISDETGSGSLVFATSPTLITPALGTPASGILTNCTFPTLNQSTTGNADTATTSTNVTVADESTDTSCNVLFTTAATGDLPPKSGTNLTFNSNTGILTATGFAGPLTGNVTGDVTGSSGSTTGNAATVTTNANLTGDVTSSGNATTIATDAVDIAMLSATGTAGSATFLRGDNTWASAGGGPVILGEYKYQATSYTTPSYTARTVNDSTTPIQLWVKDIDTNNQGIYIRIKKNAAYTDVQIA